MNEAEISMLPRAEEARDAAAVAKPLSPAGLLFAMLATMMVVAVAIFTSVMQTPAEALRQVFPVVVQPFGLSRASDMVDTNTWLTAHWDRSLIESYRTGKVSVAVDIVSSLPVRAIADDADRDTYLAMFKAHQLHKVVEHATLTFERDGLKWRLTGATPAQFDTQARTAAYLARSSEGPLTFVSDKGGYTDETAYSTLRVDGNHIGGGLSVVFAVLMLTAGGAIGVAKNHPVPAILGIVWAVTAQAGWRKYEPVSRWLSCEVNRQQASPVS